MGKIWEKSIFRLVPLFGPYLRALALKIVNGHLGGAECDRKLRFTEEKFLYVTLFNTRRFSDNYYLVDGIVTGKLKLNQSLSQSKNNLEVNCIII